MINGDKFIGMTEQEIFDSIKSGSIPGGDKYYFAPGEAFDDFSAVVYSHDGLLNFIWMLHDDPFYEYPDYPAGIQSACIQVNEFKSAVEEFTKIIAA